MRYNPDKPYKEWAEKVRLFEHGVALQRIANGEDVDLVLEETSKRIVQKLMHPILKIVTAPDSSYDPGPSREQYEQNYLRKFQRPADHVDSES